MKRKPANKKATGSLRIIAGKWRGRKITFNEAEGLRPTSDRIRETLFNWLQAEINTFSCVDLFAGSGALGLEALSREAVSVIFVEPNPSSAKQIENTLGILAAENAEVLNINAETFLEVRSLEKIGLIFLDPPYKAYTFEQLISLLEGKFQKDQKCKVFYEHSSEIQKNWLPRNWHIEKQKKAGNVNYYLLNRTPLEAL